MHKQNVGEAFASNYFKKYIFCIAVQTGLRFVLILERRSILSSEKDCQNRCHQAHTNTK